MIALVGLDGAGQAIAKTFAERYSFAHVYAVSDVKYLGNFFKFKDLERVVEILNEYRYVVLAAGLGGRGGDYLIKLVERLNNIATVFVCKPFSTEKQRIENARRQLSQLSHQEKIFIREIDELIERMPDASLFYALEMLDNEIADEIAEFAKKLEQTAV